MLLLALLAGLGVPFAFVLTRDVLNDKVQQRKEVERAGIAPILGEINHHDTRSGPVVTGESTSAVSEQFHFVRSYLTLTDAGVPPKVILVTSGRDGDGKTFFATNLAASLGLAGKKAVVADFHVRRPNPSDVLRLPSGPGVAEYLGAADLSPDALLHPAPLATGVALIGAGRTSANPAAWLGGSGAERLIAGLKERFDYVLLIAPPVGEVADALALAPHCDVTLLVVRYNYTPKTYLGKLKSVVERSRFNHPLLVLNGAGKENRGS
ncbi:MAG: CpsD/CapB family tyrosine-protein kinase [Cytophagales bacterium]|nr:CpsD/CapB family tyrosine-protein kinase [Cytophagales bacterium]